MRRVFAAAPGEKPGPGRTPVPNNRRSAATDAVFDGSPAQIRHKAKGWGMGLLFDTATAFDSLHRAWRQVRGQARRSHWSPLRAELSRFEESPLDQLRQLQRELSEERWKPAPRWGYAKRKSGGSRRGVTVCSLTDRLVQRSVLNVLQATDPVQRAALGDIPHTLGAPSSFAGVPGRGVPEALALVTRTIRAGATWVALSDVKEFFPHLPRHAVVDWIGEQTGDARFTGLLRTALETELFDAAGLHDWLDLFPLGDTGVAQGSLLSVTVGNLALRQFDQRLNVDGLTTVRYLDDFAILTTSQERVGVGLELARAELATLGLDCYFPGDGSQKGWLGPVERGFEFLGCRVHPSGISPARRARRQLLTRVARLLAEGRRRLRASEQLGNSTGDRGGEGVAQVLTRVDHAVRGWGDAFRFLSNRAALAQLDREIDRQVEEFVTWSECRVRGVPANERRRLRGVGLLTDLAPRRLLIAGPPANTAAKAKPNRDAPDRDGSCRGTPHSVSLAENATTEEGASGETAGIDEPTR